MNNIQENKLSMYLTVEKVTLFHEKEWEAHSAFVTIFNIFRDLIRKIRDTRLVQEGQITGITKDKAVAQNNAVEKGLQVLTAVFAYASVVENHKLKDRVSYSPTELRKCRDTVLVDRLTVIIEAAKQNVSELENYGITQEDIDEFQTIIDKYADKVEEPRQAITNRARSTQELKDLFMEADKVIKEQLDKLIPQFKGTSKIFYIQYQNARQIINLGSRKRKEEEEVPEEQE